MREARSVIVTVWVNTDVEHLDLIKRAFEKLRDDIEETAAWWAERYEDVVYAAPIVHLR